jgi:hypothetical protein
LKHEYREGKEAREQFDKGMAKLFQAKKKSVPKPTAKTKKSSKD